LHKLPYVFPIIGGRKVEQLKENITALDISLTPEQVRRIEQAAPFDQGFPNSFVVSLVLLSVVISLPFSDLTFAHHKGDGTYDNFMLKTSAHLDRVPVQQPITPNESGRLVEVGPTSLRV
jgi:hypothetical protein